MMSSLEIDNSFGIDLLLVLLLAGALPAGISVLMLLLLNAIGVPHNVAMWLTTIPMLMLMGGGMIFAKRWCWQRWQRIVEGDEMKPMMDKNHEL